MATALAHHSPILGKYKILETLAVGGMGRVELALNKLTGELVAIKRLREQMVWRPAARSMFEQERRLAARFDHPNITKVHESGEHDSEPFMVMEYLRGQDLRNMVNYFWERGAKPDVQVITGVLYQACLGLHHVHELTSETGEPLGIIHRDISHSNIFITETGVVKVLDFGIAKSQDAAIKTEAGVVKGKIRFMSPEQARAQPLDRRTDVFSMGVVLWEALAGGQLFENLHDVLEAYVPSLIEVRPDVPPELTQVVARALRRDPNKRWQTVDDLGRALAAAMAPLGGIAGSGEIARVLGTMSEPSISIEVVSSDRSTPDGNPPMDIPGVTLTDMWLTVPVAAPASARNDHAVSPDAAASPAPAAPRRARTLRLPSTAPVEDRAQPAKDRTRPAPARGHGRAVLVAATLIATLGTLGLWWAL